MNEQFHKNAAWIMSFNDSHLRSKNPEHYSCRIDTATLNHYLVPFFARYTRTKLFKFCNCPTVGICGFGPDPVGSASFYRNWIRLLDRKICSFLYFKLYNSFFIIFDMMIIRWKRFHSIAAVLLCAYKLITWPTLRVGGSESIRCWTHTHTHTHTLNGHFN